MWRGLPLLLCFLVCCAAFAQKKEDSPFNYSVQKELESLGLPDVRVRNHALFYFSGGPASGSLTFVPPEELEEGALGGEFTSLLSDFPRAAISVDTSSALKMVWSGSRLGLTSSSVTLPLSDLSAWMEAKNARSSFVVSTGGRVNLSPRLTPDAYSRNTVQFVVRKARGDLVLSYAISAWEIAGLVALFLWHPLVLMAAHLLSAKAVGRSGLSKGKKSLATVRWFIWGHFAAVAPMLPLVIYYFFFDSLENICGLWFGELPASLFGAALLLVCFILPATISVNLFLGSQRATTREETFEASANHRRMPGFDQLAESSRQRMSLRTWGPRLAFIPLLAAMLLVGTGRLDSFWSTLLALSSLPGFACLLISDPRKEAGLPDLAGIQSIANALTQRLGVPTEKVVPRVNLNVGNEFTLHEEGAFLTVTPLFLASLTREEQEYLIAEYLIKKKLTRFPVIAVVVLTLVALAFNLFTQLTLQGFLATFLGIFLPSLLSLGFVYSVERQRSGSDVQTEAAVLTGNLEAALSAKRKIRRLLGQDDPNKEEEFQKELDAYADKVRARQVNPTPT